MKTSRRSLLALAAFATIAACTEQEALVDQQVSSQIRIVDVIVDAGALPVVNGFVSTGRESSLTRKQIAADVDTAVTNAIRARGLNGKVDAVMRIGLSKVALVSPGQAWAVGGKSNIQGVVTLVTKNGKSLMTPTTVKGHSDEFRMAGLLGAITSPSASDDYKRTVSGFAANATRKVFENVTVGLDGSIVN